jgi:hypothetical protein
MKYRLEGVRISKKTEFSIFITFSYFDLIWRKNLRQKTQHGKTAEIQMKSSQLDQSLCSVLSRINEDGQ